MRTSGTGGAQGLALPRLCLITHTPPGNAFPAATVLKLLEAGIRFVQYREKSKTRRELYQEAALLRELTRRFDAVLIVNDYADIALAVDADGLHLGQDDLPLREARRIMGSRLIGVSTHNLEEAVAAEEDGADYIGFGALFPTSTKEVGAPQGCDALRRVARAVSLPVIAIGGITADNASAVFGAGCSGIAVSSGLLHGDIEENARRLLALAGGR